MSESKSAGEIRLIRLDRIEVLNPRDRGSRVFDEIVRNIKAIGLKKPICVTPRFDANGAEKYLLICGEGRLKAYQALGEEEIPALVVEVTDEDAFIMSLAENIARRQHHPLELLSGIRQLVDKGYTFKSIAEKTGLAQSYVKEICNLLRSGEERLIVAVERGAIPINVAVTIAGAGDNDKAVQAALQGAYESGALRGRQLVLARRVIDKRQRLGRAAGRPSTTKHSQVSTTTVIRTYQDEVKRQTALVRKAAFSQQKLLLVVGALRQLLSDENFVNLLRAESLTTMPKYLAERVWPNGSHV
ncbi:ParB/RepB/Spo0J family partition protein [Paraburkholderia youngii]|uniref:ParB family chromosome partitioning protein n=1 Tax=Paraburkholderia youngii TaxID=2782701 RepID=A0A7W8L8Z6_9BURK|nr:ParB/RepB/Spo0J family partition protein [Paraburkholderia youngii]MBB5402621.1 ParB family chromosome partitioning protein [Paraburkholderia youngii]NVI08259.1 ParB/RepB/Spo0J family partition protein [Paraburkholderia youngii]